MIEDNITDITTAPAEQPVPIIDEQTQQVDVAVTPEAPPPVEPEKPAVVLKDIDFFNNNVDWHNSNLAEGEKPLVKYKFAQDIPDEEYNGLKTKVEVGTLNEYNTLSTKYPEYKAGKAEKYEDINDENYTKLHDANKAQSELTQYNEIVKQLSNKRGLPKIKDRKDLTPELLGKAQSAAVEDLNADMAKRSKNLGVEFKPFESYKAIDWDSVGNTYKLSSVKEANGSVSKLKEVYGSISPEIKKFPEFSSYEDFEKRKGDLVSLEKSASATKSKAEQNKFLETINNQVALVNKELGANIPMYTDFQTAVSAFKPAKDGTIPFNKKVEEIQTTKGLEDFRNQISSIQPTGGARGDIAAPNLATTPSAVNLQQKKAERQARINELMKGAKEMYREYTTQKEVIPELANLGVSPMSISYVTGKQALIGQGAEGTTRLHDKENVEEAQYRQKTATLGTDISNIDKKIIGIGKQLNALDPNTNKEEYQSLLDERTKLVKARGLLDSYHTGSVMDLHSIRAKQGSPLKTFASELWAGGTRILNGGADILLNFEEVILNNAALGPVPSSLLKKHNEAYINGISNVVDNFFENGRKGFDLFIGQSEENKEENPTSAFLGGISPYVLAPHSWGFSMILCSAYNRNKETLKDLTPGKRLFVNLALSMTEAAIMNEGMRVFKGDTIVPLVVANVIKKTPGAKTLSKVLDVLGKDVKEFVSTSAVSIGSGAVTFPIITAANETSTSIIKNIANALPGEEEIDADDIAKTYFKIASEMHRSAEEGATLSAFMIPFLRGKAILSRKSNNEIELKREEQFESSWTMAKTPGAIDAVKSRIKQSLIDGKITKAQAKEMLDAIDKNAQKISQMPSEMPFENAYKAYKIMEEIEFKEKQKEGLHPVFSKMIDSDISELTTKLSELYKPKEEAPTTEEGKPTEETKPVEPTEEQKAAKGRVDDFVEELATSNPDAHERAKEDPAPVIDELIESSKEKLDAADPEEKAPIQKEIDRLEGIKKDVELGNEKPVEEQEAKPLGEVSDSEHSEFIDTGKVDPKRLEDIASKVKNKEPLSDREKDIFTNKTAEVNNLIREQAKDTDPGGAKFTPELEAQMPQHKPMFNALKKGLAAIKSIMPNIDVRIHDTHEGMQNVLDAYDVKGKDGKRLRAEKTKGNYAVFPDGRVRIDLNLAAGANRITVAHEITHPILEKAFGDDPKMFDYLKKQVSSLVGETKNKYLLDFIKRYGESSKSNEYLTELAAIMRGGKIEPTVMRKVAAAINKIISKVTGGRFSPFEDIKNSNELVDYFSSLSEALHAGKEIKLNEKYTPKEETVSEFEGEDVVGGESKVGTFSIKPKSAQSLVVKAESASNDSRDFIKDLVEDVDIREFEGKKFITNMYDYTNAGETDLGNGYKINLFGGKAYVPYMMKLNNKGIGDVSNLAAFNTKAQAETFVRNSEKSGAELFAPHSGTLSQSWQFQQHTFSELVNLIVDKKIMNPKELVNLFNSTISSAANKKAFKKFKNEYSKKNEGADIRNFSSFSSDPKKIVDLLDIKNNYSPDLRKALNNAIASDKTFQKAIGVKNKEGFFNKIMDPLNKGASGGEIIGVVKFDPKTFKIVETEPTAIDHHPSFGWTLLAKIDGIYQPTEFHQSSSITDSYTKHNKSGESVSVKSEEESFNQKNVSSSAGAIPKVAEFSIPKSKQSLVDDAKMTKDMTEDEKGNYLFYHYSPGKIPNIDPRHFGKNLRTGRDERPGIGVSMYYTRPDRRDVGGSYGYVVRVPKDKVYPFNSDPMNLMDKAKATFEKMYPGQAFDKNKQVAFVSQEAAKAGYDMTVAKWGNDLRAQTTKVMKGETYEKPHPDYHTSTVFNPKLEKYVANENKPKSKQQLSEEEKKTAISEIESGKVGSGLGLAVGRLGLALHSTKEGKWDKVDESKIIGGNRAVYGWGVYFTPDRYKYEEFGGKDINKLIGIKVSDFDFVNTDEKLSDNIKSELESASKNEDLSDAQRFIAEGILKQNKKYSNSTLDESIKNFLAGVHPSYEKAVSLFFKKIGYDGFKNSNQYVLFNFDKSKVHTDLKSLVEEASVEAPKSKQQLTFGDKTNIQGVDVTIPDAKEQEALKAERTEKKYFDESVSKMKTSGLSKDQVEKLLDGDNMAILTGTNPDGNAVSDKTNKLLNQKAEKWLQDNGYKYHEVTGKYGQTESSFLVEGMTADRALEFAKEFKQDSVAHSEGLIYSDGTIQKRIAGKDAFDVDVTDPEADYVSAIKTNDEKALGFQIGLDDNRVGKPKSKQQLSSDDIRDNMDKMFEDYSKKMKGRPVKDVVNRVINEVQHNWVKEGREIDLENAIRSFKEDNGIKVTTPPSQAKISGEKPKKVTVTERTALKDQIKLEIKAANEGAKSVKDAMRSIADNVSAMVKSGSITTKQAAVLNNRLTRVNIANPDMVDRYLDYAEKVFNDADYADKLNEARSINAKVNKAIKSKEVQSDLRMAAKEFTKANVTKVEDIDAHLEMGRRLLDATSSSGIGVKEGEISDRTRKAINIKELSDYTDEVAQKIAEADEANLLEATGIDVKSEEPDTVAPSIEDYIRDRFNAMADSIRDMIKSGISPIDGEKYDLSDEDKIKLSKLVKMTADDIIDPKDKIRALEAMDHLLTNGIMGRIPYILNKIKMSKDVDRGISERTRVTSGKVGLLAIENAVQGIRKILSFSGNSKFYHALLRNSARRIDNVIKNYTGFEIFNNGIKQIAQGESSYKTDLNTMNSDKLKNELVKSMGGDLNKVIESGFKMTMYLRQLEHESNPGSKKSPPAMAFVEKTIEASMSGKHPMNEKSAKLLKKLSELYSTDGSIDSKKIWDSFSPAEKKVVEGIRKLYDTLTPYAQKVASEIHDQPFDPFENYTTIVTQNTSRGAEQVLNEKGKLNAAIGITPAGSIKTKAGQIEERTGQASPINFDPFSSANKAVRNVMLDYHMTLPLRTMSKITDGFIAKSLEMYKADPSKENESRLLFAKAMRKTFEDVLEATLSRSFFHRDIWSDVRDYVSRASTTYMLSNPSKAASEAVSNLSYVVPNYPGEMALGITEYKDYSLNGVGGEIMRNLNSYATDRAYPHGTLSGAFLSPESYEISTNDMQNVRGFAVNAATKAYYNSLMAPQKGLRAVSETMMTAPDLAIIRPLWFGSMAKSFKKLTGQDIDFEAIAKNDVNYLDKFEDALNKSRDIADKNVTDTGAAKNPWLMSPITVKRHGTLLGQTQNYLANYSRNEYEITTDAIIAMHRGGKISRADAAKQISGVLLRAGTYTAIRGAIASGLAAAGIAMHNFLYDDDDKDELTQAITEGKPDSKETRKIAAKNQINFLTKTSPRIPGIDPSIDLNNVMMTSDKNKFTMSELQDRASDENTFSDNFIKGVGSFVAQGVLGRNFGNIQNKFFTSTAVEYLNAKYLHPDDYNRYKNNILYSSWPDFNSKDAYQKTVEAAVGPYGKASSAAWAVGTSINDYLESQSKIKTIDENLRKIESGEKVPFEQSGLDYRDKLIKEKNKLIRDNKKNVPAYFRDAIISGLATMGALPGAKDFENVMTKAMKPTMVELSDYDELKEKYKFYKGSVKGTIWGTPGEKDDRESEYYKMTHAGFDLTPEGWFKK